MDTESAKPESSAQRVPHGHEPTDVHAGWIFGIVLFLAVSGIGIHFLMAGMLNLLKHETPTTDQWRPPERSVASTQTRPSFPRLQVSPPVDLEAFRAREEVELNSYGWIDRASGIVHIPIEQAMDLLVQKGLPVRRGTNEIRMGPSSFELLKQRAAERRP